MLRIHRNEAGGRSGNTGNPRTPYSIPALGPAPGKGPFGNCLRPRLGCGLLTREDSAEVLLKRGKSTICLEGGELHQSRDAPVGRLLGCDEMNMVGQQTVCPAPLNPVFARLTECAPLDRTAGVVVQQPAKRVFLCNHVLDEEIDWNADDDAAVGTSECESAEVPVGVEDEPRGTPSCRQQECGAE